MASFVPVQSSAADYGRALIPRPVSLRFGGQAFAPGSPAILVLCPGTDSRDREAAEELNLWTEELGFGKFRIVEYSGGLNLDGAVLLGPPSPGSPVLDALAKSRQDQGAVPDGEGYTLAVDNDVAVVAGRDAAGRFYGLMSLAQLLYSGAEGPRLPGVVILDRPKLALRGVSDDISRGQVSTMDDFKDQVRLLARYKMNLFMPYLEDMLQIDGRPGFGAGRGALSAEDVRDLVGFASRLHVRVIPAFQTLGHYENFLLDPENFPLAEFPGGQCLSPAVEGVYGFLESALTAVAAAFPDNLLNVGCDESWDVGRGKSRARVRVESLAGVHASHYSRVHGMVRALGRRMLMYGDIILNNPGILERIPKDIVIVDWHYNAAESYPSVDKFRRAGYDVLVSPGLSNWSRFYPFWGTALRNIENLTREGAGRGALGAVTSSWCDFGAPNLRQATRFGFVFAAACAWNPDGVERAEIEWAFWGRFFAASEPEPYVRLNDILSTVGRSAFDDWWRHPLIGPSPRGMIEVHKDGARWGTTLREKAAEAGKELEKAGAGARANRWFMDIFSLATEMTDVLGAKFIWMDRAGKAGQGVLPAVEARALAGSARELRGRMSELRERYAGTWLRHNRPEGLENILALWDRQILYWDDIIERLESGRRLGSAALSSAWIAPNESLARNRLNRERTAYYVADIEIPAGTDSVKVQLMGESHVETWAGGMWAGRKVARWCLSEIVDRERAVILDLSGKLRPGRNRLAFSVTNYEGRVPALNVYGEIYSGGEVTGRLASAVAWRAVESDSAPSGWNSAEFNPSAWGACGAYKADVPVSIPYFARGYPSRVER